MLRKIKIRKDRNMIHDKTPVSPNLLNASKLIDKSALKENGTTEQHNFLIHTLIKIVIGQLRIVTLTNQLYSSEEYKLPMKIHVKFCLSTKPNW